VKNKINNNAYGELQESIDYWTNNRNSLKDLYPSERNFLEPALRISNSALDIGCAAGGAYRFAKEANKNIDYIGIDISESLINIARDSNPDGKFIKYDGQLIPFKEGQFDLVFSIGVLHHLNHWRSMIMQMVECSSNLTIFDLRLSKDKTLNDAKLNYQHLSFGNKIDYSASIGYFVININEFISFLQKNFNINKYRIETFGYYSKVNKQITIIPYDKVYMCCIQIEKNSKSPGIFVQSF